MRKGEHGCYIFIKEKAVFSKNINIKDYINFEIIIKIYLQTLIF